MSPIVLNSDGMIGSAVEGRGSWSVRRIYIEILSQKVTVGECPGLRSKIPPGLRSVGRVCIDSEGK